MPPSMRWRRPSPFMQAGVVEQQAWPRHRPMPPWPTLTELCRPGSPRPHPSTRFLPMRRCTTAPIARRPICRADATHWPGWPGLARHGACRLYQLCAGLAITLVGAAIVAVAYNRFWLLVEARFGLSGGWRPCWPPACIALSRALEQHEYRYRRERRSLARWQHQPCPLSGNDYWCMVRLVPCWRWPPRAGW